MSAQRAQPLPRLTPDAYLAFERASEVRHEYHDGLITLQAGASFAHTLLNANTIAALERTLRDRPCTVHSSDLRISIAQGRRYVYPDVTVICGEPVYDPRDTAGETIANPALIVEILSPSTEAIDRGKKFHAYQQIATLQDYLLIAQDAVRVEHFRRFDTHIWQIMLITDLDESIALPVIGGSIALADIYRKVSLLPAESEDYS